MPQGIHHPSGRYPAGQHVNRIIDIGDAPARLSVEDGLLNIQLENQPKAQVPLPEVAALVVSHARVSYTNAVLSRLAASGGAFVVCDERHMPVGLLLPLAANTTQTERVGAQADASLPLKKQAWKFVVQMKLINQGWTLETLRGHDYGLPGMSAAVRAGDPDNVEARAARKYWQALFPDAGFTRDRGKEGVNSWLNYGYAILRAIIGRAVCAAGLHPSLGLHHHNRYDAFCLASDLMEPYRPLVDMCAARMAEIHAPDMALDKILKREMLSFLNRDILVDGERRTLFSLAAQTASSMAEVYSRQRNRLYLPRIQSVADGP